MFVFASNSGHFQISDFFLLIYFYLCKKVGGGVGGGGGGGQLKPLPNAQSIFGICMKRFVWLWLVVLISFS